MNLKKSIPLLIFLSLILFAPALGLEIFVGNEVFKGQVRSVDGEMEFALADVSAALEFRTEKKDGVWWLSGVEIPTTTADGSVWVRLKDLPSNLVRVVENKEMGTLDLYANSQEELVDELPPVDENTPSWQERGQLVFFYAEWSEPCAYISRSVAHIHDSGIINVVYLDVEKRRTQAYKKYSRMFTGDRIPFFVVVDSEGKKLKTFSGFQTYPVLIRNINSAFVE